MRSLTTLLVTLRCTATRYCDNPPPLADRHFSGIDLTDIDIWGLGKDDTGNFKRQAIQQTCNGNRTWTSPWGKQYDRPDQIDTIHNIGGSATTTTSMFAKTTDELYASWESDIQTDTFAGLFSSSSSFSVAMDYMVRGSMYYGSVVSRVASIEIILSDELRLSEPLQQLVDHLPPLFNTSTFAQYNRIISEYGTHYAGTVAGGGVFRLDWFVARAFASQMTESEMSAQADASFFNLILASGGVGGNAKHVSQQWLDASVTHQQCLSGTGSCPGVSGYDHWVDNAYANPWVLRMQNIHPLYELFADPVVQSSMSMAVLNHQAVAFLGKELIPGVRAIQRWFNGSFDRCDDSSCQLTGICGVVRYTSHVSDAMQYNKGVEMDTMQRDMYVAELQGIVINATMVLGSPIVDLIEVGRLVCAYTVWVARVANAKVTMTVPCTCKEIAYCMTNFNLVVACACSTVILKQGYGRAEFTS